MADNQTRVIYKAIADFSALRREARKAQRAIKDLRQEEAKLNAQSMAGSAAATLAKKKQAKSNQSLIDAFEDEASAMKRAATETLNTAKAAKEQAEALKQTAAAADDAVESSDHLTQANKRVAAEYREVNKSAKELEAGLNVVVKNFKKVNGEWVELADNGRRVRTEFGATRAAMDRVIYGAKRLDTALDRVGNWRPRLVPPFIALIPIIGGILALINPLVAGLGAVAAAALGFASSLGRVAAGAIGAIPALTAILSIVGALKVAFGGIGNAFKAFSAMKKATAGAGGGGSTAEKAELSQTEELQRANDKYARSIQDVAWAQEDLDEARKDYIKRLRELQRAVDRAAMSEARAAANTRLARENYANILADPGSTKGEKMDAKVGVDEAIAAQQDVVDQNKENAADLAKMKRDGIEGDRQVIQAQRQLTDALYAMRDAQLALVNTQNGSNDSMSAATSAVNEYQDAMSKLSPSARRFVEILLGMQDAWTKVKLAVQEAFFSEFVDNVGRLKGLLPSVQSLLASTAGALGRFIDKFLLLITSPEWERDLILIGEQNVPIIENIGDALLSWVSAFKDLSIVAGPFLAAITDGMKEGAANFASIVDNARANGSLADYLEQVRVAMGKWWQIVKNIGMTLFNFSAAAGEFGEWLTDGFVKLSAEWRRASEEAREEGSPFQQYLEDIKPLLVETRGLFGDFFRWFAKTASDPENIKIWTNIIKLLRTGLGPALSRVLDVLAKSGIGESFVQAITSIVEAIATLLENGGIDGIKAFYDIITLLFQAFETFFEAIPRPILTLLASTLGTLAALRFFGLTKVLTLLIKLMQGGKITTLLNGMKGFFGLGGAAAGGSIMSKLFPFGKLASPGTVPVSGAATAGAAAAKGGGFNLLGSIAKGAAKGAGIAAIASIAGTVIGDAIASAAPEGGTGAGQRVGGGVLAGVATGAGIGALAGSIVPGIGTGIGAGVGAVVGGGIALATADEADRAAMFEEMGHFFEDVGKWFQEAGANIAEWWDTHVVQPWAAVGEAVGQWWDTHVVQPWAAVGEAVGQWWYDEVVAPFTRLAGTLGEIWARYVSEPFQRLVTALQVGWDTYVVQPFQRIITAIQIGWDTYVVQPFQRLVTAFQIGWNTYVVQPFQRLITAFQVGWQTYVVQPFQRIITAIQIGWNTYVVQPFQRIITGIQIGWQTYVVQPFQRLITAFQVGWNLYVVQPFQRFVGAIQLAWQTYVITPFTNFIAAIKLGWENFWKQFSKFNLIDAINTGLRALFLGEKDSGDVPGGISGSTAKKVSALMPAGMRISSGYRTPAENRAAGGSSTSLHMDRANPAVDVVGSKTQMANFARLLGRIGGWRQLYYNGVKAPGVGYWPGHDDHIHVANTGGQVPGRGNGDTVPSLLTPGEFVIRKAVTERIGPENLARLNAGVMSFAELLRKSTDQPGKQKTGGGISFFDGGGLVSGVSGFPGHGRPPGPDFGGFAAGGNITNIGTHIENLNVNNPEREPTSVSLPKAIRAASYLGASK